jgi:hypothetical protein
LLQPIVLETLCGQKLEERVMKVNEQWLMSYLIDQNNARKLLAKLSPKEVSLFRAELQEVFTSISEVKILLEEQLISEKKMLLGGGDLLSSLKWVAIPSTDIENKL